VACAPVDGPPPSSASSNARGDAGTAPAVTVVSLEPEASAFWAFARGQPLDKQLVLWDQYVERRHPALYDQVVWETATHADAAATKRRLLAARFAEEASIADELPADFRAFEQLARRHVAQFRARFPDTADVPIYALLSPRFDAKGAVLDEGSGPRVVLAFGVDTIALHHEVLPILFPHELFHVHHATVSGFLDDGVMPGVDLVVPMWEEGLATYVASLFVPGASDGALLLQESLGRFPADDLPALAGAFLADAGTPAIDREHPETFARWFEAGVPSVTPTTPNRSAYLLGLHVVRRIAQRASLDAMVHWRVAQAHDEALAALRAIAAGPAPRYPPPP